MAEWKFVKKSRNQKSREAMQGEFFANSSIDDEAHALTREAIQNSLDARIKENNEPIRVRFGLSGDKPATPETMATYITEYAWEHFHANNNGLNDPPDKNTPCHYLTYEDFGTTGLTGDVMQSDFIENSTNPFYFFMRAEGQSGKSGDERGRWGVGKFVFPHASAIRSFFMFTARQDDKKHMMAGQCILKSHEVGGIPYTPDGWFGDFDDEDDFQLPDENEVSIKKLCGDFGLARNDNETGLSIIVPYVSDEFLLKDLAGTVIREYFYPILKGELEVLIEQPGESIKIDQDFLTKVFDDETYKPDTATQSMIDIAINVIDIKDEDRILLNCSDKAGMPKWNERIDTVLAERIRSTLDDGGIVALRVPLYVQKKQSDAEQTYFDMYLEKDESSGDGKPLFIREGIKIPEVNARAARGYACMTIIEDKAIASMLGDAENPAHTEWEKNSSNYKSKYNWGPSTIDFVRSCLFRVIHLLSETEEEEDRNVLADVFFIDQTENDDDVPDRRKRKRKKPEEGSDDPDKPEPPEAKSKKYNLSRIEGGFSVREAEGVTSEKYLYTVKVAYDRVKGDPWKKYSPNDFSFSAKNTSVSIKKTGIDKSKNKNNLIGFRAAKSEFELKVTGFDVNRDLIVDVQAKEIADEAV